MLYLDIALRWKAYPYECIYLPSRLLFLLLSCPFAIRFPLFLSLGRVILYCFFVVSSLPLLPPRVASIPFWARFRPPANQRPPALFPPSHAAPGDSLSSRLTLFLFFSPLLFSSFLSSDLFSSKTLPPPSTSLSLPLSPLLSSSSPSFVPFLFPLPHHLSLPLQESFVRRVSKKCEFGFCSLSQLGISLKKPSISRRRHRCRLFASIYISIRHPVLRRCVASGYSFLLFARGIIRNSSPVRRLFRTALLSIALSALFVDCRASPFFSGLWFAFFSWSKSCFPHSPVSSIARP